MNEATKAELPPAPKTTALGAIIAMSRTINEALLYGREFTFEITDDGVTRELRLKVDKSGGEPKYRPCGAV